MDLTQVLTIVFTGIATGFGTALGSYFATAHLIKNFQKVNEKLKNGKP